MLRRLPDDDVRAVQWRFADRDDLRGVVLASRAVARGPVARLVARGARHSDAWTPDKAGLVKAFDAAGLSVLAIDAEHGGRIDGPKNLAIALAAFELAWVDAGAATTMLGNVLALAPIHERGTGEQRARYMGLVAPGRPGESRDPWHGAFVLTEPLPHAGVDAGILDGKMRVAEWKPGKEPVLQIDKRGRYITGMGHADFVAAAVASADDRIKGTAFVLLEKTDEGTFDAGVRARKLVHQLASARDPVFAVRVPASRIVGGYTVRDGAIVPNCAHGGDHRRGVPADPGHRGPDDGGEDALGRRPDHPLPPEPVSRRRRRPARLAPVRARAAAGGGCAPPAGGCLGDRGGGGLARVRGGARVRRARSARAGDGRAFRR